MESNGFYSSPVTETGVENLDFTLTKVVDTFGKLELQFNVSNTGTISYCIWMTGTLNVIIGDKYYSEKIGDVHQFPAHTDKTFKYTLSANGKVTSATISGIYVARDDGFPITANQYGFVNSITETASVDSYAFQSNTAIISGVIGGVTLAALIAVIVNGIAKKVPALFMVGRIVFAIGVLAIVTGFLGFFFTIGISMIQGQMSSFSPVWFWLLIIVGAVVTAIGIVILILANRRDKRIRENRVIGR